MSWEKLTPEAVRVRLAKHNEGDRLFITAGPYPDDVYKWLAWKQAKTDWWSKVIVISSVLAAMAGIVAAVESWLALSRG
jgi:hypothetical protein